MDKISQSIKGNVGNLQQFGKIEANRDVNIQMDASKKKDNLKLKPEGPSHIFLEIAKKYWDYMTSGVKEGVLIGLLPAVIGVALAQDFWGTKIISNLLVSLFGTLILVLQLSVIIWKYTTDCPKCNKGFALVEVDRELVNSEKYKGRVVNNLKIIEQCRYCGYEQSKNIVEEEERSPVK